jgi:hypothetical protein
MALEREERIQVNVNKVEYGKIKAWADSKGLALSTAIRMYLLAEVEK